jgi:hypothetical protein
MNSTGVTANIQTVFLNQIRERLPANSSFADELAELLNISRDSAYRRIRGETVLSLDEVKKLYDQYGLSIDAILSPDSNMVLINHQAVDFNYSLSEWLKILIQNLELVKSSKELELIIAAKDIPVFRYFRFPELATFKLFVWLKAVIKDSNYEHVMFKSDVIPKEILTEAARASHIYSSIPSTEIWSDEVINGTLKQIEFCHECGYFPQRDMAAQLYDYLIQFVNHIKEEAANGKKVEGGSFNLYHNEILIPDNTISAKMQNQRVVYINYNMMDFLSTNQAPFCEKTEAYMSNLIKNSALISTIAEKERNRFFNKIDEKIRVAKKRLG